MTRAERERAEQVSAAVEQLLRDPDVAPERVDPADSGLVDTARQLARLPALLGPVEPAFEQQIMRRVRAAEAPPRRTTRLRVGWAAAGLVAVLAVVLLLTPLGQTAVASFMAVFNLGRTEVRIESVYTPPVLSATAEVGATAVQKSLTLQEARAQSSFPIPQPAYIPAGYRLTGVHSYTYPDLPDWVPQPIFVELVYGDGGNQLIMRVYSITLGDEASISRLNLQAGSIRDAEDVDVNGQPGVLLRLGVEGAEVSWQEVVWEQDDLILSLSSAHLDKVDLLQVARSVR
jgi:hypothetical protein